MHPYPGRLSVEIDHDMPKANLKAALKKPRHTLASLGLSTLDTAPTTADLKGLADFEGDIEWAEEIEWDGELGKPNKCPVS